MTNDSSEKLNSILQNPAMMSQIKALADTMTAGESEKTVSDPTEKEEKKEDSLPEEKALTAGNPLTGNLLSPAFEQNLRNTCALLQALKPFLDARRREKIEKVLQMMHLAEMAGRFGSFL